MNNKADTKWDDDEIVFTDMSPDTKFVFDRMTEATIQTVDAREGEDILDLACGRAIDAFKLSLDGSILFGLEPSPIMIEKALEFPHPPEANPVILLRAIAENIPLADDCLDKIVCKGAADHFVDLDKTFSEIARVLRPGGRLIISVANFSSLSCVAGRTIDRLKKTAGRQAGGGKKFFDPPDDHNFVFNLPFTRQVLNKQFRIEKIFGVSLLWGLPWWGKFLRMLPEGLSSLILHTLDRIGRVWVKRSDVIVVLARPIKHKI
jgi:SAM-dependent methyltransferase